MAVVVITAAKEKVRVFNCNRKLEIPENNTFIKSTNICDPSPASQLRTKPKTMRKLLLCFVPLRIGGLCVAVSHTSVRSTSLFSFSRKHSEHMLLTRRSALGIFEAPALPYGGREMRFMVERVVQHVRTWSDTQHIKCLKVKYYHENLERAFKSCHPISKRKDLYLNRRGTSGPMDHRCLEPSHVPGKAK